MSEGNFIPAITGICKDCRIESLPLKAGKSTYIILPRSKDDERQHKAWEEYVNERNSLR